MKRFILVAASLLIPAISATAQNNAEQITFSAQGATLTLINNTKATSTPFGFWLWCSAEPAAGSNGGYAAHFACQGSMYFYGLDKSATHVVGHASEDPDHPGIYTMTVLQGTLAQLFAGTLNPAYSCSLTNTVPDAQGPINSQVTVSCIFSPALGGGAGSATVNAGVNVTGPK